MPDVVATLRLWRSVLAQPRVLPVFVATGAGRLARASAPLAVVLVLAGSTGSYAWAGAAAGVLTLADAATAPLKGRLADRFGRALGLLPGAIFQGAADFDLELIESRTLGGHTQELIYRPRLHG